MNVVVVFFPPFLAEKTKQGFGDVWGGDESLWGVCVCEQNKDMLKSTREGREKGRLFENRHTHTCAASERLLAAVQLHHPMRTFLSAAH